MELITNPTVAQAGAIRRLMATIARDEKHWPDAEVAELLDRDALLVGVFDADKAVGAAQILYGHPYPVEKPPFNFVIPEDGRIPCEVTLIGIDDGYRRTNNVSDSLRVLDMLVKGLYRTHLTNGGTHILALCEDWTTRVLTDGYVGIVGGPVTPHHHYWCGQPDCPGPRCQPTAVIELDMRASEANWATNRPDFWRYLNEE